MISGRKVPSRRAELGTFLCALAWAAFALLCLISGCGSGEKHGSRTAPPAPAIPERVVSLSPSTTEVLFALGLGERVVGVTKQCDYPPAARSKPTVGDVNISVERVVSLKPDLVVGHGFLNRQPLASLKKAGIRTLSIDPTGWSEVGAAIEQIARACGVAARGEALSKRMEQTFSQIQRQSARARRKPLVLFAVQGNPVWAAGPKTFVDDMIKASGGVNAAAGINPGFNHLSQELSVNLDPDFIFVTDSPARKFLITSPLWKQVKAVRERHVVEVDPDLYLRPTPRLIDGLRQMASVINPAHATGASARL